MHRLAAYGLALILSHLCARGNAAEPVEANAIGPQGLEFFEKEVRPLLVKHCYECHSSKSEEIKGNLSLESRPGWERGGDSGPAIVPGKLEESPLIEAIRFESLEMPPERKLKPAEIAIFEKWVAMGAPDPRNETKVVVNRGEIDLEQGREFWAFQPVRKPPVPQVKETDWPLTGIDRFILARLETAGLAPSKDASRHVWLRRVTYDLTGLPPTVAEINEFVADASPDAYEKVVTRLVDSPQFGEHWARHWMDVVRYADSNGSDFNATFHNAWRYRNYVINALNRDKPYDQFVREQLAGDLLSHGTPKQRKEQLVATGFLMVGPKMLSERDKEKLRMDVIDEQIDTVGKVFLGMTLGCARCHDHKFDPVRTDDYYALAGIFRSTNTLEGEMQQYVSDWKETPLPVPGEHAAALDAYEQEREAIKKQIADATKARQTAEKMLATLAPLRLGVVVDDAEAKKVGKWKASTFSPNYVGKGYVHDDKQDKGKKSITYRPKLTEAGEYEVRVSFAGSQGRDKAVPVKVLHADGEENVKIDQTRKAPIGSLFLVLGRYTFDAGTRSSVTISNEGTTGYVIADSVQFIPIGELEQPTNTAKMEEQMSQQRKKLTSISEQVKKLEAELKDLEANAPPPRPMAMAAREDSEIGDCHICIRGEPHRRGKLVKRGFLAVINEQPVTTREESGRRELANWIASDEHPLTARVMVNRVWGQLLGEGIVRSRDNFGQLGDRPSHPQLLDYLAANFTEQKWSIKTLARRIVLSRVYRQRSAPNAMAAEADPENRLLWRAHRKRLPAEALRDGMLAIAGQLDPEPSGSPVEGMGRLAIDNNPDKAGSVKHGKSQKRSIYQAIIRNDLRPLLTVFDFADPDLVVGQRPNTNVPAQALFLLNSPFVRDISGQTAEKLLAMQDSTEARVESAYLAILNRPASSRERERAMAYLKQQPEKNTAAWTQLIQALLASSEFRLLD